MGKEIEKEPEVKGKPSYIRMKELEVELMEKEAKLREAEAELERARSQKFTSFIEGFDRLFLRPLGISEPIKAEIGRKVQEKVQEVVINKLTSGEKNESEQTSENE